MRWICSIGVFAVVTIAAGCSGLARQGLADPAPRVSAPELMVHYGCPTCHVVPGVPGAVGKVGPSLRDLSHRSYLAGTIENTPQNLVSWIQHPQRFHPGTAMPEMGVTATDANEIASFLEASR